MNVNPCGFSLSSQELEQPATIQFIRAGKNPLWTDSVLEQFRSLESSARSVIFPPHLVLLSCTHHVYTKAG